jgi:hypothetical protein
LPAAKPAGQPTTLEESVPVVASTPIDPVFTQFVEPALTDAIREVNRKLAQFGERLESAASADDLHLNGLGVSANTSHLVKEHIQANDPAAVHANLAVPPDLTAKINAAVDAFQHAEFRTYWWGWSTLYNHDQAETLIDVLEYSTTQIWDQAKSQLTAAVAAAVAGGVIATPAVTAILAGMLITAAYLYISLKANTTANGVIVSGSWAGGVWTKPR